MIVSRRIALLAMLVGNTLAVGFLGQGSDSRAPSVHITKKHKHNHRHKHNHKHLKRFGTGPWIKNDATDVTGAIHSANAHLDRIKGLTLTQKGHLAGHILHVRKAIDKGVTERYNVTTTPNNPAAPLLTSDHNDVHTALHKAAAHATLADLTSAEKRDLHAKLDVTAGKIGAVRTLAV